MQSAQDAYVKKIRERKDATREELTGLAKTFEKAGLSLKELAVSGNDLTAAGLRQGRQIGEILERMLEDVLTDPGHNDREYLLEHYL